MIVEKSSAKIVCDINGCSNEASYFIKKDESELNYDSLKLCSSCIKELSKVISKIKNKEKEIEK